MFRIRISFVRFFMRIFGPLLSGSRLRTLLRHKKTAIVVGSSLNIKRWVPITLRWEMIVLPDEIRIYPYSPDKGVWDDLQEIRKCVEKELGPFEVGPEVHYVDSRHTAELLRGGDAVAIFRRPKGRIGGIAYVVLHPFLGLVRYREKRRAHILHELIELALMQRKSAGREPRDYACCQHTTVKRYERLIGKRHHLPVLIYTSTKIRKLSRKQKKEILKLKKKPLPATFEEQDLYYRLYYHILGIKKEVKYL